MDVYWLEQTTADVPTDDDWLSLRERAVLSGMRFAKRRTDWRLGRWTAKHAASAYLKLPTEAFPNLEIRASASGAPEVFWLDQPAEVTISISHRNGTAACAITQARVELGCDLEMVEDHSEAFILDYFTAEEQALVAQATSSDRLLMMALLWSAKESALKALREGLRMDTRSVSGTPQNTPDLWKPVQVRCLDGKAFHGWWQQTGELVRTMVALPAPNPPAWIKRQ